MDTKWRKFSRSGGFKAILLLIVLGCGKTEKIPSDDSPVISLYFNVCRG